jgi:hypothetical protein
MMAGGGGRTVSRPGLRSQIRLRSRIRRALRAGLGALGLVMLLGVAGPPACPLHAGIYALQKGSSFVQGCFAPCLCAIFESQALTGTFGLVEVTRNPAAPFREFAVVQAHWELQRGDAVLPITGSGHYRVGGEVALVQQLQLDLRVGDGPVQHFDSGLVPGGGEFPKRIDVRVSVNGGYCYDTQFTVVAEPLFSNL